MMEDNDETMIVCLVETCRHNDREGCCRTDGGCIQITMGADGRPSCEEYEPDPRYFEGVSPLMV